MSRPRLDKRSLAAGLIGTACGAGCVLPMLFVVGVFGGIEGRPVWAAVLLVAIIGVAVAVLILPSLRQRDAEGNASAHLADQPGCEQPRADNWND